MAAKAFDSAFKGDVPAVVAQIAAGLDVDTKSADRGATLLYTAARFGHAALVTALLEKGASFGLPNESNDGSTPLHGAAYGGHPKVVQLLIDAGAKQVENKYGETPQMNAEESAGDKAGVLLALRKAKPVVEANRTPWTAKTLPQLKTACAAAKCSQAGKKKDLVQRLLEAGIALDGSRAPLPPPECFPGYQPPAGDEDAAATDDDGPSVPMKAAKLEGGAQATKADEADDDGVDGEGPTTSKNNERRLRALLKRRVPGVLAKVSGLEFAAAQEYLTSSPATDLFKGPLGRVQHELLEEVGDDYLEGSVTLPPDTARLGFDGIEFPLPLTSAAAKALYGMLEPAKLGVEGKGDVLDTDKRKSRDRVVDDSVTLPPAVRDLDPKGAILEGVRRRLCPDAAQVVAKAYKVVGYQHGDFFRAHVDTTSEADHFATLSLHLPCVKDYDVAARLKASRNGEDDSASVKSDKTEVESNPDTLAYDPNAKKKKKKGSDDDEEADEDNDDAGDDDDGDDEDGDDEDGTGSDDKEIFEEDDVDEPAEPGVQDDGKEDPTFIPTLRNGQLIVYTGRDINIKNKMMVRNAITLEDAGMEEGHFEPDDVKATLSGTGEIVIDLGAYTHEDAATVQAKTGVPVRYGVWMTNLLHEVRPLLLSEHRFVVTYKLYRSGSRALTVPRAPQINQAVGEVFRRFPILASHAQGMPDAWKDGRLEPNKSEIDDGDWVWSARPMTKRAMKTYAPRRLGLLLHHTYPPGGLSLRSLKGVDAVAYHALSQERRCFVIPAFFNRSDYMGSTYNITGKNDTFCTVAATSMPQLTKHVKDELEENQNGFVHLYKEHELVVGCVWARLGHGSHVAGGLNCYGNCDGEVDWWYRGAALIVTDLPGWGVGKRWAFAAQRRGSDKWQSCLQQAVTFRTVCEFL